MTIKAMIFVYLSEMLGRIHSLSAVFGVLLLLSAVGFAFAYPYSLVCDDKEKMFAMTIKQKLAKLTTFCIVIVVLLQLIPSQKTMLTMAGIYVGSIGIEKIAQDESFTKAKKLIDLKLDEFIEESQSNISKLKKNKELDNDK